MEGKTRELNMATTSVDELISQIARLEESNIELSANVVSVQSELERVNAHITQLHRNAQAIKENETGSGRKAAMAK